jgi:hypothetical protein
MLSALKKKLKKKDTFLKLLLLACTHCTKRQTRVYFDYVINASFQSLFLYVLLMIVIGSLKGFPPVTTHTPSSGKEHLKPGLDL